jgi:MFS family permease
VPFLPESARLRKILLAYSVNELGTWVGYVALSVGVYDHTHSALAVAALFLAARLLPALLTPALVARVESSARRGVFGSLYLFEAVITAFLALILLHFWLPGVLILVAVDGTAALAAGALLRAATAHIAVEEIDIGDATPGSQEEDDAVELAQRKANAALNLAYTMTVAIGPAVGGLIVAATGGSTALLVDALSFGVCGALLIDLRLQVQVGEKSLADRLRDGWTHLRAVPQLQSLLLAEALGIVFFASVEPIEVIFTKSTLHSGDAGFGLFVAAWGVGMVLGGVLFARAVNRPLGAMLVFGTLVLGLSDIATAASPTLTVACVVSVIGGVGNGVQWPSLISAVQRMTPSALHGRLMSAVESIGAICPAIGFVIGGLITQLSSPRVALLVAGLCATAVTGLFVRISAMGLPAMTDRLALEDAGAVTRPIEPVI